MHGYTAAIGAGRKNTQEFLYGKFLAGLKKELIYQRKYETIGAVKKDIFTYTRLFYNRKRLQTVPVYEPGRIPLLRLN